MPWLAKPIENTAHAYLGLLGRETTEHYKRCSYAFKHRSFAAPALFVYSLNDPIADARTIEQVVQQWREKGQRVETLRFEKSKHVSHLRRDPLAYETALDLYLEERLSSGDE
jgi:predicted alpha/beta-fold hydrolase